MIVRSHYRQLAAVALAGWCGCAPHGGGPAAAGSGTRIRVVAVERVYGDIARQLGGSDVDVTTLLDSPTADPHEYEPTARDADAIAGADLVIENGLGYDAFAAKLVAASPNARRTVLDAGALGGHRTGDNPHVWYEAATLHRVAGAVARDLATRLPARRADIASRSATFDRWVAGFSNRLAKLAARRAGTRVAITEPVFDYVLHAAGLAIATPVSFSHAIEEGSDPAPQDVATMRALVTGRRIAALVYNAQTVEPSTTNLLELAKSSGVNVVPVTETLPANDNTQEWMESEVSALTRAL